MTDAIAWLSLHWDLSLQWLELHKEWIVAAIFLVSLVESIALVGLILPSTAILLALTAILGHQGMSIIPSLLAASAGSLIGDIFSFWLGRLTARGWMARNQHRPWVGHGQRFFARYGVYSVVIARFISPLRPVMPLMAGSLGMRPLPFLVVAGVGAVLWSPFYLLPGYAIGHSLNLESWMQPDRIALVVVALVLCVAVPVFIRSRLRRIEGAEEPERAPTLN